jgi:hypothetical protein
MEHFARPTFLWKRGDAVSIALSAEIRRVEDLRRTLKAVENPLSGHYKLTYFPDVVVALRNGIYYGSEEEAARRRQEFYRRVGVKVKVGEELEISIGIGEPVSTLRTASASNSGSTSY